MEKSQEELIRYQSILTRQEMQWQMTHEFHIHSDRAAIDIGISGLNTAILINAGALVALLALIGQLWDKDNGHVLVSQILGASVSFAWGLGFAAVDFIVAYFYQSIVTEMARNVMEELAVPEKKPNVLLARFHLCSAIVMILLAVASVTAFILGILSVVKIFQAGIQ